MFHASPLGRKNKYKSYIGSLYEYLLPPVFLVPSREKVLDQVLCSTQEMVTFILKQPLLNSPQYISQR